MARDSLVREAVRKTAVGRFDSGPYLFGAHAVDGRGRLVPGRFEARRFLAGEVDAIAWKAWKRATPGG
jgi:hypothetical protein